MKLLLTALLLATPCLSATTDPTITLSIPYEVDDAEATLEVDLSVTQVNQLREKLAPYAPTAKISFVNPGALDTQEAEALVKRIQGEITLPGEQQTEIELVNIDSKVNQSTFSKWRETFRSWLKGFKNQDPKIVQKADISVAIIKSGGSSFVWLTSAKIGSLWPSIAGLSAVAVDCFFGYFGASYPEFKKNFRPQILNKIPLVGRVFNGYTYVRALIIDCIVATSLQAYFRELSHLHNPSEISGPLSQQWALEHLSGNLSGIALGSPAEMSVLSLRDKGYVPPWVRWLILQGWNVLGTLKGLLIATPYGKTSIGSSILTMMIGLDLSSKAIAIGANTYLKNPKTSPHLRIEIKAKSAPTLLEAVKKLSMGGGCQEALL